MTFSTLLFAKASDTTSRAARRSPPGTGFVEMQDAERVGVQKQNGSTDGEVRTAVLS